VPEVLLGGWRRAVIDEVKTVVQWITERHGDHVASDWLWNCTPYPCGLPTGEQLEEGLQLAAGELTIGALIEECLRRLDVAMSEGPP